MLEHAPISSSSTRTLSASLQLPPVPAHTRGQHRTRAARIFAVAVMRDFLANGFRAISSAGERRLAHPEALTGRDSPSLKQRVARPETHPGAVSAGMPSSTTVAAFLRPWKTSIGGFPQRKKPSRGGLHTAPCCAQRMSPCLAGMPRIGGNVVRRSAHGAPPYHLPPWGWEARAYGAVEGAKNHASKRLSLAK